MSKEFFVGEENGDGPGYVMKLGGGCKVVTVIGGIKT